MHGRWYCLRDVAGWPLNLPRPPVQDHEGPALASAISRTPCPSFLSFNQQKKVRFSWEVDLDAFGVAPQELSALAGQ